MMNRAIFLLSLAGALALSATSWAFGAGDPAPATPPATSAPTAPATAVPAVPVPLKDIHVVLHSTKGDIALTLFANKAPMTVANFLLNLVKSGYYDGLTFHRVEDFMIQGSDP